MAKRNNGFSPKMGGYSSSWSEEEVDENYIEEHGMESIQLVKTGFRQLVRNNKSKIDSSHWLYIMQSIDAPGFIKIGISQNVGLRNARPDFGIDRVDLDGDKYTTASKDDVASVWTPQVKHQFIFSSQKLARSFEQLLHHSMRDYCVGGEFFYVNKTGMDKLEALLNSVIQFTQSALGEEIDTTIDEIDDWEI